MDLSTVVDMFSVVAVVSGLIFAGLELRQFRKSRERESALELYSTIQSPEFLRGLQAISQLPDDQSKQQIEELLGDRTGDVYCTAAAFEGLGVLVHRGEINLGLVKDLFSGPIVVTWSKLRRYIEDERMEVGRETWAEWIQWLAERVMEDEETTGIVPAYIAYRDWQPG